MAKKNLLGSVYAIRSGGRIGVVKLIFLSARYRNMIAIRLFDGAYLDGEATRIRIPAATDPSTILYTASDVISARKWEFLQVQEVTENERMMTKRIVAGNLWQEDTPIGPAMEIDYSKYPKQLICGYKLVDLTIEKLELV